MWKQVAYTNFFELHRPDTSLSNETLGLATVTHLGDEASMVMQWTVNPPLYSTTGSIPVISTKNIGESLGRRTLNRPRPKGCPILYLHR